MSYSKTPESSKYSCTDYTKDAKNWTYYASSENRIAYKIDSLCHTALTTAYPKYLSELLNVYTPGRPLRSSLDPNILNIAAARTKSYGQRAFAYQGPINWNRVTGSIRPVEEKDTFKDIWKQQYFQQNASDKYFVSSFYIIIYHKFVCTLLFSIISMWLSRFLGPLLLQSDSLINTYYVLWMC